MPIDATVELAKKYNRSGWVLYYRPGCVWCDRLKAGLDAKDPKIWPTMNKVDVIEEPGRRPKNVNTVPTWVNTDGDMWNGVPMFRESA